MPLPHALGVVLHLVAAWVLPSEAAERTAVPVVELDSSQTSVLVPALAVHRKMQDSAPAEAVRRMLALVVVVHVRSYVLLASAVVLRTAVDVTIAMALALVAAVVDVDAAVRVREPGDLALAPVVALALGVVAGGDTADVDAIVAVQGRDIGQPYRSSLGRERGALVELNVLPPHLTLPQASKRYYFPTC